MRRAWIPILGFFALLPVLAEGRHALTTVPLDGDPTAVAYDATSERAYVTLQTADRVAVVDVAGGSVVSTVAVGARPMGLAFDPLRSRLWVANMDSASVSILDTATGAVVDTVDVGPYPSHVAADPESQLVFISDSWGILALDASSGAHLRRIWFEYRIDGLAVNPSTRKLYVSDWNSSSLTVFDADSGALLSSIPVGTWPVDIAVDTKHNRIFVSDFYADLVWALDGSAGDVLWSAQTGLRPAGLSIDVERQVLYVTNTEQNLPSCDTNDLTILDARSGSALGSMAFNPCARARSVVVDADTTRVVSAGEGGLFAFHDGKLEPPRAVQARPGERRGTIELSWAPPPTTGHDTVVGYRVYRRQGTGEPVLAAQLDDDARTYRDTNLADGTEFFYRVSAMAAEEGPLSNEVSARTLRVPSTDCTSGLTLANLEAGSDQLNARLTPAGNETWLCVRADRAGSGSGGKLVLSMPTSSHSVDEEWMACAGGAASTPPLRFEIGDPSDPDAYAWIGLTTHRGADETWVCVAGSAPETFAGRRLVASSATPSIRFEPDPPE